MTYIEDESSAEDNLPEEYWLITHGVTSYRIATGNRDLQIDGDIYTAIASARSEQKVSVAGKAADLVLTLPVDHPFIQRYLQQGIPPRSIVATVWRRQNRSGETRQMWTGRVSSVAPKSAVAEIRVPARSTETMLRVLPNYSITRLCSHILYSPSCGIDRNNFRINSSVIYVNGRDVRFDIGSTDLANWSRGGVLIHDTSGEKMAIRSQTYVNPPFSQVVEVSLQLQIVGMKVGDAITIHAGCNHGIIECRNKFNNVKNFGGFPNLPDKNPFVYKNRVV